MHNVAPQVHLDMARRFRNQSTRATMKSRDLIQLGAYVAAATRKPTAPSCSTPACSAS
jgi:flagellar biosynthesis/type III secretory pathway ATPase